MPSLRFAVLILFTFSATLRAQTPTPVDTGGQFLTDFAPPMPTLLSGGRTFPVGTGSHLALSMIFYPRRRGYRLSFVASTSHLEGPRPPTVGRVQIRARAIDVGSFERLRLFERGRRVTTVGYGAGAGVMAYYRDERRAGPIVKRTVPAITGSVDVGLRFGGGGSGECPDRTLAFYTGVRSSLLLGAPVVGQSVPASDPIPARRGVGSTLQMTVGIRFGRFC